MLSGYLLSFLGGVIADIARKLFLPRTEAALARVFPSLEKEHNKKENLEHLKIQETLIALGKDPSLADMIEQNSDEFKTRLELGNSVAREAFVEVEAERIQQFFITQADMNMEAIDRFKVADRLMVSKFDELISSEELTEAAKIALQSSQDAWLRLRETNAKSEAILVAEGGSMMPMIHSAAMEQATISRLAQLNQYQEFQTHK